MRSPEPRTVFMCVAMVGIGSVAGGFFERLSFPRISRVFNVCASSKQFLVEIRNGEHGGYASSLGGLRGHSVDASTVITVDGRRFGDLERYGVLRLFLCEGNQTARIEYPGSMGPEIKHAVDFAVSRPSLFHLTAKWVLGDQPSQSCISEPPCSESLALELSPYEPDDPRVRIYPEEEER